MAKRIIQPYLNPVIFFPEILPDDSIYHTRYFDMWPFEMTIKDYQQYVRYRQPWQTSDTIRVQLQSEFGGIVLRLLDCYEQVVKEVPMQQKQQWEDNPTFFIYEGAMPLNDVEEGIYKLQLRSDEFSIETNELDIRISHSNTVLLKYSNLPFKDSMIFATGFAPYKRVFGSIQYTSPASEDTLFIDMNKNASMQRSISYRLWKFVLGAPAGVPDYEIDKTDRIIGCSELSIDNRLFTKNEGAKWEEFAEENYPMRAWAIELLEAVNSTATVSDNTGLIRQRGFIISVESKGFGLNQSSGELQVIDVI